MNWLGRYRAGERDEVWRELRQLGDTVRDPGRIEDAAAVCDEMARRARWTVETLVERLVGQGYRFLSFDSAQTDVVPHVPPTPDAPALVDWLRREFGPLPLTLESWIGAVGDVWLVGTHPDWPESSAADPLVIEVEGSRYPGADVRGLFVEERDMWRETTDEGAANDGFVLPLAPDSLHKDNVSGGAPYGMRLPDACVDGIFVSDVATPFVAYLNRVFANGGFPGNAPGAAQRRLRQELSQGLLAL